LQDIAGFLLSSLAAENAFLQIDDTLLAGRHEMLVRVVGGWVGTHLSIVFGQILGGGSR